MPNKVIIFPNLSSLANHGDRTRLIFGATNPDNQSTLLRGSTLRGEDGWDVTPEHLAAHELAHIYMHSSNERKVEDLALTWLKDSGQQVTQVAASR